MAYGTVKVDNITFTNGGIDQTVTVSGIVQSISGNITATGTIQGATIIGTSTVSGATVTGNAGVFTTVTGGSAGFTTVTGTTVTGTTANFATLSGTTITGSVGNFASGSAAAPSVSVGTTDNGLYSPGTDQVALSTNGTGRLFVAANGRVGIGVASPQGKIHSVATSLAGASYRTGAPLILENDANNELQILSGSTSYGQLRFGDGDSNYRGAITYDHSADAFTMVTAASERLRITSTGLVGIGTSAPSANLDVTGTTATIRAGSALNTDGAFLRVCENQFQGGYFKYDGATNLIHIGSHSAADTDTANDANRITIVRDTGNVGIGTSGPASALHVSKAGAEGYEFSPGDEANVNRTQHYNRSTSAYITNTSRASAHTWEISGTGEKARIDSSGRLLVGTSSGRTVYGIDASIFNEGVFGGTSSIGLVRNSNNTGGPYVLFGKSRGTANGSNTLVQNDDILGGFAFAGADGTDLGTLGALIECKVDGTPGANDMPGRLVFSTTADGASSPTERLRITSAGNVGIGTTSPTSRLTVYETSTAAGAADLIYVATAGGGGFNIECSDLSAANPDWAIRTFFNEAITFKQGSTERARIDSSGRLLVGTSSAVASSNSTGYWQLQSSSFDGANAIQGSWANNSSAPAFYFLKSRGGSVGTQGLVQNNDAIGAIQFEASDGVAIKRAANIVAFIDGTPGTDDMPGRLVFSTTADGASSPTERMRITSGGSVLVNGVVSGRLAAVEDAAVSTSVVRGFANNASFTGDVVFAQSAAASGTSWNLMIGYAGTSTAVYKVIGNGNVQNTNNSYGAISDIKLKENIVDANSQWDDIKALQIRKYNFKEGQTHTQIGLIAQEVELVSPGLVSESPDRDEEGNDLGTVTKSVNYSVLYMKAVKALQEAMERIETLEAKVAALEA